MREVSATFWSPCSVSNTLFALYASNSVRIECAGKPSNGRGRGRLQARRCCMVLGRAGGRSLGAAQRNPRLIERRQEQVAALGPIDAVQELRRELAGRPVIDHLAGLEGDRARAILHPVFD